jgi:hypothetical protein
MLAKELGMIYKCKIAIIPYVLTWDGIVTSFHKKYQKQLGGALELTSSLWF